MMPAWSKHFLASIFWLLVVCGTVLGSTLGQSEFIYNQF